MGCTLKKMGISEAFGGNIYAWRCCILYNKHTTLNECKMT
jgi:hypothetical protein